MTTANSSLNYPPSLDLNYYRGANSDLATFSDDQLTVHFRNHGKNEGRAGSPCSFRENFLPTISPDAPTLEIGPFCGPQLRGDKVKYFDIADRDGLMKRAAEIHYPFTDAPFIDYVSPTGDMDVIVDQFEQIFSSHNIEHQPNLVRHFRQISRILGGGGRYFLIVPDKRFCFDHFLPETTIADVLGAYIEQKSHHSAKSVLEHRHLTTHNEALRHWQGDHGMPAIETQGPDVVMRSVDYIIENAETYLDTHAWHFTPESFQTIVAKLYQLRLTEIQVERVYNTPYGRFEFCAILSKD
jgi:SAM-dependent methyltransferase